MNTISHDTFDIEGILLITKVYEDGRIEEAFREKNLITMAGKSYVLSSLWATGPLTPISQLHAGTGGTIDPQGLYPKPVLDTMTNLYNPIVTLPVSYIQNTATPSTSFVANMDTGTGNNQLITEAGLFTSSGIMFNIKTFPGIPKTSEFSLNFNWTVTIA